MQQLTSETRINGARPVLTVRDVSVRYDLDEASILAVNGVSFDLNARETFAIVGESGSGKSTVALSLLGLVPVVGGEVELDGNRLTGMDATALAKIRGSKIAMIFQEPMTSLNPVLTVGFQLTEAIRLHTDMGRRAARDHAAKMLGRVGISDAERRLRQYPHELSGGMRQRVMIATALSCSPAVLVADEPTTALDVTVQAQVLALIDQLRDEFGTAVVLITHDIGVVAETADRIAVMYAGRIVEEAPTAALFADPRELYPRAARLGPPGRSRSRWQADAHNGRQRAVDAELARRLSFPSSLCAGDGDMQVGTAGPNRDAAHGEVLAL